MRDARFTASAFGGYEDRQFTRAQECLAGINREPVEAVLTRWWEHEVRVREPEDSEAQGAADRLQRLCADMRLKTPLAEHLPAAVLRDDDAQERRAAALLLGGTAATAVRRAEYGVTEFDRIIQVLQSNWRAVEAFLAALVRDGSPAWPTESKLAEFSELPRALGECLDRHCGRDIPDDRLRELEDEARAKGVVAYVWGRRHDSVLLSPRMVARCRFLASRDWGRLLSAVESLPLRELRDEVWQRLRVAEDREAIVRCLSAAATVFERGAWTGKVVALQGLSFASMHADLLHQEVEEAGARSELEKEEFPEWFRQVVHAAKGRTDGRPLLLLYAAEVVADALRPPWGVQRWSSGALAIDAVAGSLGSRPTANEMREIVRLGGEKQATREATYLVTGTILGGDARSHWQWYRDLLESSDEELCHHAKTWAKAPCFDGPAHVLAALPDPVREWREAWAALFLSDRERARFDRTSQTALLPSAHLIRVASALLRSGALRADRREFFSEIRSHVRVLLAYDRTRPTSIPPLFVSEALDLAFPVFGEEWPAAIAADGDMICEEPQLFVFAAAALLRGGVPVEGVEEWCRGRDLDMGRILEETEAQTHNDDLLRLNWSTVVEARRGASPNTSDE